MRIKTRLHYAFSHLVWEHLPSIMHKFVSNCIGLIFSAPLSKHAVAPLCRIYQLDDNYLSQFIPASSKESYKSFQDFFTRKLVSNIKAEAPIWPCEGFVCDHGEIHSIKQTNVKGEMKSVRSIFGSVEKNIPDDYYFVNIFLHNHNYHRLHSPINGRITRIEFIEGKLLFLRPWLYVHTNPSEPSFKNERVNIDITDDENRIWYLSFVGGMGVGTVKLTPGLEIGSRVVIGEEIGMFLLGSTCCIALPHKLNIDSKMKPIFVNQKLDFSN